MGRRIINTQSMVHDIFTKTYYTYQIYNGKILNRDKFLTTNRNSIKFRNYDTTFGKINNCIKCFFKNISSNDAVSNTDQSVYKDNAVQKHRSEYKEVKKDDKTRRNYIINTNINKQRALKT